MTAPLNGAPPRLLGRGAIAQLVERVLCKHEVVGSIPSGSTIFCAIAENKVSDQVSNGDQAGIMTS